MKEFIYDEEARQHTLGGSHIGSVTQIIDSLSDFSMIPPKVLARKCELGINFHKAIELYVRDDLCVDSLDPDLVKPMNIFIQWDRIQTDRESAVYEKPMVHRSLKYCGKVDRVSDKRVVDFKLRIYNPVSDPVQMAGYEALCDNSSGRFNKLAKTVVCFDIKGNIKIHDAESRQAFPVFVTMLNHYREGQEFNKIIQGWKDHQKG